MEHSQNEDNMDSGKAIRSHNIVNIHPFKFISNIVKTRQREYIKGTGRHVHSKYENNEEMRRARNTINMMTTSMLKWLGAQEA